MPVNLADIAEIHEPILRAAPNIVTKIAVIWDVTMQSIG